MRPIATCIVPLHQLTSIFCRQADLLDISSATDIHGTKFDDPTNPIAKKGALDKDITPGTYKSFVSFIDDTQLARFGLHNGKPADQTLIDAKWESLALAPCFDSDFPDDFFLFTAVRREDLCSLLQLACVTNLVMHAGRQ